MSESKDISKIKDKYYDGHTLDSEEMDELMAHLEAMQALLEKDSQQKESSNGDGFTKYG